MFLYQFISNTVHRSCLFGLLIDDSFYFCIILIDVVLFLLLNIFLCISEYLYSLFPEFLHLLQRRPTIYVAFIVAQFLFVGLPLFVEKIILVCHFWRLFHLFYYLLVARPSEYFLLCNSKAELIADFDVQLISTLAFLSKYTILWQKILIFIRFLVKVELGHCFFCLSLLLSSQSLDFVIQFDKLTKLPYFLWFVVCVKWERMHSAKPSGDNFWQMW